MKNLLKIVVIFVIMFFIFLYAAKSLEEPQTDMPEASAETVSENIYVSAGTDDFFVLKEKTGEIVRLSEESYVIGAVFAEMPADYPEEALKAQALAAKTYAVRRREEEILSPTENLHGAYISDNSSKYQGYLSEEEAKALYGEFYDESYKKISEAVKAVSDEVIVYGGEPIIAAFHAISAGKTESAENIWGSYVPYLVSEDSGFDEASKDFRSVFRFSEAELKARLSAYYDSDDYSDMKISDLAITERSEAGTVLTISVKNYTVSGKEFREIFSLPSCFFEFSETENGFLEVECHGRGHGAGLSQYGAKVLAGEGYSYKDIIKHYYRDAEIYKFCFESDDT